ncbi:hypothetical protein IJ732_06160 [bacterium]|nr:hypothetical protein [bacterium]
MGLAASQSRFLLLTARQNSLNSRMLSLQNQDMALQRQTTILSQDYNKKQNAQYVTYNDETLNYAALMRPNTTGSNHMVTDSSGAVVLTESMAGYMHLKGGKGDGKAFKSAVSSPEELMKNMGLNPPSSNANAQDKTWATSAYKYDDNIMNQAVVTVQAASPLALSGYLWTQDSNGNMVIDETAGYEYAMGLQQNTASSGGTGQGGAGLQALACISTLDKFAYTEPNVHAVVNEFVSASTTAMSNVMSQNLGSTDAVQKALDYASRMTQEKYGKSVIEGVNKPFAGSGYNGLPKGITAEAAEGTGLSQTIKDVDGETDINLYNSTGIVVSEAPYNQTITTNIEPVIKNGQVTGTNYAKQMTTYDGKDVFVNTAQLTATFLNYFDIGMMLQLGSDTSTAFAKYLEGKMDETNDIIALRNEIKSKGLQYFDETDNNNPRKSITDDSYYANYPVIQGEVDMYKEVAKSITIGNEGTTIRMAVDKDSNNFEQFSIQVPKSTGSSDCWTVTYKRDTTVAVDDYGNYTYKVSVEGATAETRNLSIPIKYLVKTGKGSDCIGQYGNTTLIDPTFETGAAGIFGSKNIATNSYKNVLNYNNGTSNKSTTSTTKASDADGEYAINYYRSLYNALAAGGWVVDGQVNDASYLSQQMLQGNMVLQEFNNSSSWSVLQLGDSNNGLDTVDDTDTREKAKAEYESQSAILKTKQTFLENEIESIKTQSEALDTEKDSLKNIMEKEQEKFKVFVG